MGVLQVACLFSSRFLCLLFEFVTSFVSVWFRGVDFLGCVSVGEEEVWRMAVLSLAAEVVLFWFTAGSSELMSLCVLYFCI